MTVRVSGFRVRNFRSIVDTGWVDLSRDCITALVGQNEAGKTSLLNAIYAWDDTEIRTDDQRVDESLPSVSISFELASSPSDILEGLPLPDGLDQRVKEQKMRINLVRTWNSSLEPEDVLLDPEQGLIDLFPEDDAEREGDIYLGSLSARQFADEVWALTPKFVLFNDKDSLLPDQIDLSDISDKDSTATGIQAVRNFIVVSELEASKLGKPEKQRADDRRLADASRRITVHFQEFWEQTVGKSSQVSFDCVLRRYPPESGKAGQPYLEFLVNDNRERLHLAQRSKGFQWYLSFYLQLIAAAKQHEGSRSKTMFLIDEPGGSLHATAQRNVLKVLETVKEDIQVLYTTHSPFLINITELGRLLVAERTDDEDESSPTVIKTVHELGGENQDALFPVYTAMGSDLSNQQVIERDGNVLLEEVSAYHYARAFWHLKGEKSKVQFFPCSGASTVIKYASLLTGWGIRFIVLVDDDEAGKRAVREIKKHLLPGMDEVASNDLARLPIEGAIEDIFSLSDFRSHVLLNPDLDYQTTNSSYVQDVGEYSKGALAADFYSRVAKGEVQWKALEKATKDNVTAFVDSVKRRLASQSGR